MAIKAKKEKVNEARKNAEAAKAKKKAERMAKAKPDTYSGPVKKEAKPASIIKSSAKKKK